MCNTNLMQNRHLTMGFAGEGLWGMGYDGLMGYGMQIPAYQLGGLTFLWGIRGYGLRYGLRGVRLYEMSCIGGVSPSCTADGPRSTVTYEGQESGQLRRIPITP